MLRAMVRFLLSFRGLRGRLVLTYTLVTVLALLALEMVMGSGLLLLFLVSRGDSTYLSTARRELSNSAADYLEPGKEDLAALQDWAQYTLLYGYPNQDSFGLSFDNPTRYVGGMYIVDLDSTILACAPNCSDQVGLPYVASDAEFAAGPLDAALHYDYPEEGAWGTGPYSVDEEDNYQMAIPILYWPEIDSDSAEEAQPQLVGVVIVTLEPLPPLSDLLPGIVLGIIILAVTGFLLLVAVTPFGMLFGVIMSRGLARRLGDLTRAADAWSEGNFDVQPRDRGRDEIGHLSLRMRHMAERIQNLLQSQQELAMLEERNRLARDLHDTIKQQTFATQMQLRAAQNLLETDPAAARQTLQEAETLVKAAQQDLSLIIAELRPAALEGQGLALALQSYLDTWSQHTRIPAELHVQGERSLPLAVEQTLYRIAQETLSNIARHSSASAATLNLAYEAGQISLVVHDDGRGFDRTVLSGRSFGLQSMQQRAAALGGRFEISGEKENGTTVTAVIPLKAGA